MTKPPRSSRGNGRSTGSTSTLGDKHDRWDGYDGYDRYDGYDASYLTYLRAVLPVPDPLLPPRMILPSDCRATVMTTGRIWTACCRADTRSDAAMVRAIIPDRTR